MVEEREEGKAGREIKRKKGMRGERSRGRRGCGARGRSRGRRGCGARGRSRGRVGRDREEEGDAGQEGEAGQKGRESMEMGRKKKQKRPGEKVMDRETTINQNDTKEYLHSLLDAEKAIESNMEAPEGEGRSSRPSKQEKDGRGRWNRQWQRKARRRGERQKANNQTYGNSSDDTYHGQGVSGKPEEARESTRRVLAPLSPTEINPNTFHDGFEPLTMQQPTDL